MPTAMHELSTRAIKYYSPSVAKTSANYARTMNTNAKLLDQFCTKAGLTTLSSEWWHFQENAGHNRVISLNSKGCSFHPKAIVSTK